MWIRDVIPTIVVFVTKSSSSIQSSTLQQATVSTILLTDTVVAQSPTTNAAASAVIVLSTVAPLIMSLTPLSLSNPTTLITLSTTSASNNFLISAASSSLGVTSTMGTSGAASVTKTTSLASPSPILTPDSASSTNLSLAIALPIGIVCLLGLLVLGLYLFRSKIGELANKISKKANSEILAVRSSKVLSSRNNYSKDEIVPQRSSSSASLTAYDHSTKVKKPTFLNRISRIVNVPGLPIDFKSPLFLRRFNLQSNESGVRDVDNSFDRKISESPSKQLHPSKQLPKVPPNFLNNVSSLSSHSSSGGTNAQGTKASESLYSVIKPYIKRLNDEITVCIGEDVKILKFHSDGWATVKMVSSSEVGVIPLMCLRKGK